jgi:sec-independent protein translocase protein TatB
MGMPPTIEVASLGMWDSLILMVMALVVFGPRRLPAIGKQIGRLMYEVRKASNDFRFQMEEELRNAEEADRRKKEEERQLTLAAPAQTAGIVEGVSLVSEAGSFGELGTSSAASGMEGNLQASETDSGTPGAIASPYPDEGVYPDVITAAPEAPAEETYPRIQPPSTGEPVAAARPGRRAGQALASAAKKAVPAATGKEGTGTPRARAKKTSKQPEISNG